MTEKESPLRWFAEQAKRLVTAMDVRVFGSAFAAAMLVHMYMFTNKFLNHDDVDGLLEGCESGLSSGRWLLPAAAGLTGNFSSSWLSGMAGSLCLALLCVLTVRLFRIRQLCPALLMSLLLVSFPSVTSTFTYMFNAAPDFEALTVSVLAALLIRKETVRSCAAGILLLGCAMGIYQAYLSATATLLVMCLILDVCDDRWGGNWKAFLGTAVRQVLCLLGGLVFYFAVLQMCLKVTGTVLSEYQGISSMGRVTPVWLLERAVLAFQSYFRFLTGRLYPVFPRWAAGLVFLSAAAGFLAVGVYVVRGRLWRQTGMMVFLFLLCTAFPVATMLPYLMTGGNIHMLMLYPEVFTLVIPSVILDRLRTDPERMRDAVQKAVLLLAAGLVLLEAVLGWQCILADSRAYFAMDITCENVYAFYAKLTAKIEMYPGYTPDTLVALAGTAKIPETVPDPGMTGVLVGEQALNMYSRRRLMLYFLGTSMCWVDDEWEKALMETEKFRSMPCYPAQGSIDMVEGVLTVKFSEADWTAEDSGGQAVP